MMKDNVLIKISGSRVDVKTYVDIIGARPYAGLTLSSAFDDERWTGPSRSTRAAAERDADVMLDAMRQMADGYGYVVPAPVPEVQPQTATHTIVNVGGTARDRWTCGERHAEARWDADARMWRADVWGADGHECTYWAPSAETAAAAAAVMLGEVAS